MKESSKKRKSEDAQTEHQPIDASPSKKQRTTTVAAPSVSQKDATPDASQLETHSPFVQQTTSFYLPLAPISHAQPIQGLCAEHISPLLLTYYPPLRGVILSYANARLSESPHSVPSAAEAPDAPPVVLARSIDEYATTFVWLTADFTVLRPTKGCWVEGHVNLQNESYLGLVCWNFFNAGIERRRLPKDWQWVGQTSEGTAANGADTRQGQEESSGYFVDGSGEKVEGLVRFRVRDFESAASTDRERGFLSIEGTLLTEQEDAEMDEEIRSKQKGKSKARRL